MSDPTYTDDLVRDLVAEAMYIYFAMNDPRAPTWRDLEPNIRKGWLWKADDFLAARGRAAERAGDGASGARN